MRPSTWSTRGAEESGDDVFGVFLKGYRASVGDSHLRSGSGCCTEARPAGRRRDLPDSRRDGPRLTL